MNYSTNINTLMIHSSDTMKVINSELVKFTQFNVSLISLGR